MYYLVIFLKSQTGNRIKHAEFSNLEDFWWWDRIRFKLYISSKALSFDDPPFGVWKSHNIGNAEMIALLSSTMGSKQIESFFTSFVEGLQFKKPLQPIWDQETAKVRSISRITSDLYQTKAVLTRTVNNLLERGEKLGSLETRTDQLVDQSKRLREKAKYRRCRGWIYCI